MDVLGALLGGAFNLIGGAQNNAAAEQINQQNIASQQLINNQNLAEQEKFAQQGVQWRVADAKAAGINPLAALGASTASFSNLVAPQASAVPQPGAGMAAAGQDISRAIQAMQSPEQKAIAAEKTRLDLEAGQLDNDLKRQTLASAARVANQPGTPPGLPPGVNPDFKVAHELDTFPPDATIFRGSGGAWSVAPSARAQQSMWGNPSEESAWWMRNILPMSFGYRIPAAMAEPDRGFAWYVNPFTRSFYQAPVMRKTKKYGVMDTDGGYLWDYRK